MADEKKSTAAPAAAAAAADEKEEKAAPVEAPVKDNKPPKPSEVGGEWPPKDRPATRSDVGVTRDVSEIEALPVPPGDNQVANEAAPVGDLATPDGRPEPECPPMRKHDERRPFDAQIGVWSKRTSYRVGDRRVHMGNMYICVKDGVSSDVDGPRQAMRHIIDGTAVWDWGSTYPTP